MTTKIEILAEHLRDHHAYPVADRYLPTTENTWIRGDVLCPLCREGDEAAFDRLVRSFGFDPEEELLRLKHQTLAVREAVDTQARQEALARRRDVMEEERKRDIVTDASFSAAQEPMRRSPSAVAAGALILVLAKIAITGWYVAGVIAYYVIYDHVLPGALAGLIPGSALLLTWVHRTPGESVRWIWLILFAAVAAAISIAEGLIGKKIEDL